MLMRWYGYGCFGFSNDRCRLIFDPHDGKSLGIFPPKAEADIVLVTHNTFARNCFRSIRGTHADILPTPGLTQVNGFPIESFESRSTYDDPLNCIYRFTMDGVTVVVSGGLGSVPDQETIEALKGADILVVPVGEYATLTMDRVKEFVDLVGAPIIVPSEFKAGGTTLPLSNIQAFSSVRPSDGWTYMGSEIEFTAEDIAGYSGTWIFNF